MHAKSLQNEPVQSTSTKGKLIRGKSDPSAFNAHQDEDLYEKRSALLEEVQQVEKLIAAHQKQVDNLNKSREDLKNTRSPDGLRPEGGD